MKISALTLGTLSAKTPIIQGAMGVGISGAHLAAAVANQGGIGTIAGVGIGYKEADYSKDAMAANLRAVHSEIKTARELSPNGIIAINLMVAISNYKEMVQAAAKEGIDLIVSGAGLPTKLPEFLQGFKTKIAPIVSSAKAAKLILRYWDSHYQTTADMIIVEGPEAGGHLGFKQDELEEGHTQDLMTIMKEVIETIKPFAEKFKKKIPVVAAGGIYNGQDISQFLLAGASGVQLATRFICTDECDINENYKNACLQCQKEDIIIIKSPVGMPGRALNNKFIKRVTLEGDAIPECYQCLKGCNPKEAPYCISRALINCAKGDVDNGVVFMGSNAYRIKSMTTVEKLMTELVDETTIVLEHEQNEI